MMKKLFTQYKKRLWPRRPVIAGRTLTPQQAKQSWHLTAEDVVVDMVNTTLNSAERLFLFVSVVEDEPLAEMRLVIKNHLHTLDDITETIAGEVESRILPKAQTLFAQASHDFTQAGLPGIAYVEIQTEQATGAWFSRIVWQNDPGAMLPKHQVLHKWLAIIKAELPHHATDSDQPFSWYPNAAIPPAKNSEQILRTSQAQHQVTG